MEKAQDSYKSRMAQKWGIPVVSLDFVDSCLEAGKLLDADKFIVVGRTAAEEFSSGKIVGRFAWVQRFQLSVSNSLVKACAHKVYRQIHITCSAAGY